jgi:LacI family transcriptional regulator
MSPKSNITIKELASDLGLSGATVSNALNNKGRLSELTRQAVLRRARETGYEANIIGKALIEKKTDIIGVFVPEISNEYYSLVLSGIEEVLDEKRYSIILIKTSYEAFREKTHYRRLKRLYISGLIFLGGVESPHSDLFSGGIDIPVLFIDRRPINKGIAAVNIDNLKAMSQGVLFLSRLGHKKIGYFANFKDGLLSLLKERFEGFSTTAKRLGIQTGWTFNQKDLETDIDGIYGFVEGCMATMSKQDMPTAFMCQNDLYALCLIKALSKKGIKVPQDVSVMGFDDISISKYIVPSLTTITQPKKEMGKQGAELLLKMIEKEDIGPHNIILKSSIVKRGSVKKL